jgi:hypothetical protein
MLVNLFVNELKLAQCYLICMTMSFVVIRRPGGLSILSVPKTTHMQVLPQLGRSAIRNNMLKLANSKLDHIYMISLMPLIKICVYNLH